jgi:dTDP-4-dehydrorhamnose 3,5-epimerase
MKFTPAEIDGAFVVSMEPFVDERGTFARAWCEEEFRLAGVAMTTAQTNVSSSLRAGTIRGLHWQAAPCLEAKLLRCTAGAIFDVIADVRRGSSTFGRWQGFELSAQGLQLVYIPQGCAHGYQTLVDGSEITYNTSTPYAPHTERGLRWDDPTFDIQWPIAEVIVSSKDASWPDFDLQGER